MTEVRLVHLVCTWYDIRSHVQLVPHIVVPGYVVKNVCSVA